MNNKNNSSKINIKKRYIVIGIILFIICILICSFFAYFNNYYKADVYAKAFLESSNQVKVEKINNIYYFNGEGKDTAIIFYPGAKVEATSYAPLLYKLAEEGIDCFLIEMPFNFALFNSNAANEIIDKTNYEYKNWYLAGHSLGGVVASMYENKNSDKIKGLILLASYPNQQLSDNTRLLFIYGSKDSVINLEQYEKSKQYWSRNSIEILINGGNHAQFGNYGAQDGDNEADITTEEQQKQTISTILDFVKEDTLDL